MTAAPKPRGLSRKQIAFIQHYLRCGNATESARLAGYKGNAVTLAAVGSENLRKPPIASEIAKATKKSGLTPEVVLGEILRLARSDIAAAFDSDGRLKPIHEIPEETRRAISSIETETDKHGVVTTKVKFWDKPRTLELLAKHLNLLTEKHQTEHTGAITITVRRPGETAK